MAAHSDFETHVLAFEKAWRTGEPPRLSDYLPESSRSCDSVRDQLLVELISIDLEYRWRKAFHPEISAKRPARLVLEDYICRFKELGSLETLPVELIAEEYRVRHRWGDKPAAAHYLIRFGCVREGLSNRLRQVDEELAKERGGPTFNNSPVAAAIRHTIQPSLEYRDYLLQKLIGSGGSGKVYRARELASGCPVAIKFLKKTLLADAAAVERFTVEARTVASLRNPGIVAVEGLGSTPHGGYFIVMELIDGSDLLERLTRGPIDLADAMNWTAEVCAALACAHAQQVVHCDIKPGNVLLDSRGRIHVTDFGLAQSLTVEETPVRMVAGTVPFMAPEQISQAWGSITPRTDVYGMGALLHTLLTGQPPMHGCSAMEMMSRIVSATPISDVRDVEPAIPRPIAEICLKALAKSSLERYATAWEMRESLLSAKKIFCA